MTLQFCCTFCISGFDLIDVGKEEVLLITGKNVSRRMITYALQGLLAVFGEYKSHIYMIDNLYCNLGLE